MHHLSTSQREKIIVLYEQNVTKSEIARQLQTTRKTVQLWIRRHIATGDTTRNTPDDKKSKLSPSSTNKSFSVETINSDAENQTDIPVEMTLTPLIRKERIRFAQNYLSLDWLNNAVIFSDERHFKTEKNGQKILWRRGPEKYHDTNILPSKISKKLSLSYWGWISSKGPGKIVQMESCQTGDDYVKLLHDVMLPSVRAVYPEEHIYFVQESTATRRDSIVHDWLKSQRNMTVINWPSKSPDLNPVHNLWCHIALNWDPSKVLDKSTFNEFVKSTWESLSDTELCWTTVASMSNRLQQVIDEDGRPLNY